MEDYLDKNKDYLNLVIFYVILIMFFLKQIAVILTITLGLITFAQSETSGLKKG